MRSSSAAACSPSSLTTSACANGSNESRRGAGRATPQARRAGDPRRARATPRECRRPSSHNASKRSRSSSPGSRAGGSHAGSSRAGARRLRAPAKPRNRHLKRLDAALGLLLAPQVLNEPIPRDRRAAAQQQRREQRALARTRNLEHARVGSRLDRPQDSKLHAASISEPPADGNRRCRQRRWGETDAGHRVAMN